MHRPHKTVGLVWEGCREGGREGTQQRRASGTGQGQQGKGMRRWGSGMGRISTRVSLATTLLRHLRRSPPFVAATASSSTPPPPIHLRISVALLAPKAFLATAFLMLGRHNVVLWITLERHTPRSGQETRLCMWAWYVEHVFYIPSRTRKSDLRARCPTVVCGWSPVTLGPAFELVTLRGGFQTSTGESVTGLVMVSLELEHAHGARRGNIRAYRGMQSTLAGGSHVAWRTLRMWTGFISASKTASEGALGLWCITGGGAGGK